MNDNFEQFSEDYTTVVSWITTTARPQFLAKGPAERAYFAEELVDNYSNLYRRLTTGEWAKLFNATCDYLDTVYAV